MTSQVFPVCCFTPVDLGIESDVRVFPGSNVNLQSNSGESSLHAAAKDDHSDVVEALIAAGKILYIC